MAVSVFMSMLEVVSILCMSAQLGRRHASRDCHRHRHRTIQVLQKPRVVWARIHTQMLTGNKPVQRRIDTMLAQRTRIV